MISVLFIILSWGISITVAWGTIRQSKGADWYTPISNKQKMVMSVINISIIIIISMFFLKLLLIDYAAFIVINILSALIIPAFFIYYKIKSKKSSNSLGIDKTLKNLIERFFTVFNIVHMLTILIIATINSLIYCDQTFESTTSLYDFFYKTFTSNYTFNISLILVFWTSLVTAIITLRDWLSNNNSKDDYGKPQNSSYFWQRVNKRGK